MLKVQIGILRFWMNKSDDISEPKSGEIFDENSVTQTT